MGHAHHRRSAAAGVLLLASTAAAQAPFTEEAVARGLIFETDLSTYQGHGSAFADLDGDSDPDVVLVGRDDGRAGIFENDGTGQFIDRSRGSGIPLLGFASGVSAGDYDGDGDLDLYFTQHGAANVLARNDGDFVFTDVSAAAGVNDAGPGQGSAWSDYDGDGDLDLYLSNYTWNAQPVPNRLYRNLGDGTFVDSLAAAGMTDTGLTFQASFFDFDRDGDGDLYLANDRCQPHNFLWENVGGSFVDITTASGTGGCMDAMCVALGDFDTDGTQDIYVTNTPAGGNALYLNQGTGTFLESAGLTGTTSGGLGWGAVFLDFDNNGHQELYVCNSNTANRLYQHDGTWPSADRAADVAVNDTGASFTAATADIDGDGDIDLLVVDDPTYSPVPPQPQAQVKLYVNHEGSTRHWARFRVAGEAPNVFAVGAEVEIAVGGATQLREVIAGSNFKSQNELVLHFGLDTATSVDQIDVRWPGGATVRTLTGLAADLTWTLWPPQRLGDGDGDGDADLDDFVLLAACLGPLQPGCEALDLESDGDVDASDLPGFLARYEGPLHDCDANGIADLQDIVDGSLTDSGNGIPDECEASGAPAGALAGQAGLLLARDGADLDLAWSTSCVPGDGDYAIYAGALDAPGDHVSERCSTAGAATATLAPLPGNTYYLVVPHNGAREGSAGESSVGPRPQAAEPCLARQTAPCP